MDNSVSIEVSQAHAERMIKINFYLEFTLFNMYLVFLFLTSGSESNSSFRKQNASQS
jgi:hypothetical protein